MKSIRILILAGALCVFGHASAYAQSRYPVKPIRLIVPAPAGGATDALSRLVAVKLTETVGWQIVVDNRAGMGGNIGLQAATQAADGYTMVMGQTSNIAIAPALYEKLPYDPLRDFVAVTLVSASPIAFSAAPKSSYKTLADFVTAAKAKPAQLTYASPGVGSLSHLTGELFQRTAGIRFLDVPYKGSTLALPDLMGGRIDVVSTSLEAVMPQMKAGAVRVLAITSLQRSPAAPDVPTVSESGYKDFQAVSWYGILVAKGAPAPIVDRLTTEITKILLRPEVKERFVASGSVPMEGGPKAFSALLHSELPKWARVIKESGVKVE